MAQRYIDVVFNDDGTFEIDAVGFKGRACDAAVAAVEAALGKLTSRTYKPEHKAQTVPVKGPQVKA